MTVTELLVMLLAVAFMTFIGTAVWIVPAGMSTCRAANPGFECNIGWVKGEAFK